MFKRILRTALLGGMALSALAITQPALAYTDLGTTGTVGAHSLVDTKHNPGAVCTDKSVNSGSAYKLKHIDVSAPLMKAVPGHGNEKVGWSFTIQRQDLTGDTKTDWMNRYTSPTFISHTDSTHYAAFTQEGVKVIVPYADGSGSQARYRAFVLLTWYKANGTTVLGTAKERVDWYDERHLTNIGPPPHNCYDWL